MRLLVALLCLLVVGCSSKGFNRGELHRQIGIVNPVTTNAEIKAALSQKANLPKPFKLAIYFKEPQQKGQAASNWRWTEEDREIIFSATKEMENKKIISKVFPIVSSLAQSEDLKSLRLLAAKHGADALLIINGISDIDRYINDWGWSYALILPSFFVPGSKVDGLFISTASLWDVRNEYLYLTAESEGNYSENYVAAFGESDKEVFNKTKTSALKKLKEQIKEMAKGS